MAGNTDVLDEVLEQVSRREDRFRHVIQRASDITALASGNWAAVFIDDAEDAMLPMVRNLFRLTIEEVGRRFAQQRPSEIVRPANGRDETKAEEREQALQAYTHGSRFWNSADWAGMDMVAAGYTAIRVWPNMRDPIERRFPQFRRLDPRMVLPEPNWSPDKRTDNVLVRAKMTLREVEALYPAQMQQMLEALARQQNEANKHLPENMREIAAPAEVEIFDWYSSRYIARVAAVRDQGQSAAVVLDTRENDTGVCPVAIAYRPTWANEPMGALDDSKGIVRLQNRYMRLLFDYFVDMVYGGKLVWNVKNPHDRGPGVVYYALGPDAKMDPITPQAPSFQALGILQQLDESARSDMTFPASVEGDVQLNKASAAFLTRAQGQINGVAAQLMDKYAVAKQDANEAAFAQDEAWCNARKKIYGFARGKRFSLVYTPKETINGDYANIVTYGTTSGLDRQAHSILLLEKRQARTI